MALPRITTRGYYDRATGATINGRKYSLFPPGLVRRLSGSAEIAIMVHGMRNDSAGAASKIQIATQRLAELGYTHPVIGFSYDSNIAGAHLARNRARALAVARIVARKNGLNLAFFITDFKRASPETAIRILGHSLGSEVILSAIRHLDQKNAPGMVEAVYLFAASVTRQDMSRCGAALGGVIKAGLTNYYGPNDEELSEGHGSGINPYPVGLCGMRAGLPGCRDVRVSPENHRFASYAAVLESFP